jgi:fibronectin-binding autotransporter adhesin
MSIAFVRSSRLLRTVAAWVACSLLAMAPARAEIIYWNGTASPGNVWSDTNAWSTTTGATTPPPIAPPGASDDVVFNISTDNENETVRLNGAQSALSILFRSTGTTTLLGGTNAAPADDTLTVGTGGITLQAGAGAVTIGQAASPGQVAVLLGGSQTWTNNSSSLLTVANGIARAAADSTDRTLTVAGSGSTTLSGAIADGGTSGTLGLSKTGTGTLTLSGTNTFTGATNVAGGTLALNYATNNTSKLADAAGLTINSATVDLAGGSHTEIVSGTTITGAARITRSSGTGVVRLNTITRTAGATLNLGTASIAQTDTSNTNGILGGWATVGGADWAVSGTTAADTPITALGTVTALPAATGSATTNYQLTGGTSLTGAVAANSLKLIAPTGDLALGSNLLTVTSGGILMTGTTARSITGTSGATRLTAGAGSGYELFLHQYNNGGYTISAVIGNNATNNVSLRKAGTGNLTLSAANTYGGGTRINEGTVTLGNAAGLGSAAGWLQMTGGTLNVGTYSITVGNLIGGPTARINPGTTAGTYTLTTNFTTGTGEFAGTLANNGSGILALTKSGNLGGELILSGTNTFTGGVTINGGSITITNSSALGTGTKTVTMTAGTAGEPVLRLDGTAGPIVLPSTISFTTSSQAAQRGIVNLAGTNEIQGNFSLAGGGGSTNFEVVGGSLTLSGTLGSIIDSRNVQLAGAGNGLVSGLIQNGTNTMGLLKQGAGTWTLSNANTFTGGTTISGGTLRLTNQLALQNTVVTLSGGGVAFDESVAADAFTFAGLGGAGGLVLANNAATPAPIALTLGSTNATSSHSGAISGAGSLTKIGNGILTLSGANSYSGGTTVSTGILTLNATTALPGDATAGAWSVASGGTLAIGNTVAPSYLATLESAGNVAAGGWLGFDTTDGNRAVTENLALTGPVAKVGVNTLTLSGTNAVAGGFRTVAGTLQFNSPAATGGAPLTISGGSTNFLFDGNGGAAGSGGNGTGALQTIDFGSGLTVGASGTLVVGRLAGYGTTYATAANKTAEFDTLTIGANTLTVTNSNGYGALFSGATTLTGAPTFSIANATASDLVQGLTLAGPVAGSFGFTKSGSGALMLANTGNSFTGNVAVTAGRVAATSDGALGNAANQIVLSNNAGLRAAGTFSSARTIQLGSGTSNGVVEVVPGATFTLTSPFAGASATTKVTKADDGTLVLATPGNASWGGSITAAGASAQVLTGGLQIDQGAVRLGDDAALGDPTNIVAIGNLTGAAVQLTGGRTIPNPLVLNMGTAGASATGFYGGFGGLGVLQSLSGTNTWSGPISMNQDQGIGAATGSTLNLTGGANLNVHILSLLGGGTINISTTPVTGVHSLYKLGSGTTNVTTSIAAPTTNGIRLYGGGGTMVFSGAGAVGTNTANVEVYSGDTLVLDNSGTNVVNRLGGTSPTNLTNGTLRIVANGSAASSETMGRLRSFWGGNTIEVVTSTQNTTLAFPSIDTSDVDGGSILTFRSGGTGADFGTASNTVSFTTAPTLVSGLMPATVVIDSAGTNFTTYSSGSIRAFSAYATGNDLSTVAATATPRLTASAAAQTRTLNALAFGSTATLSAAAGTPTVGLTAGNILVQSGTATIASGVVLQSTTGTYDYALNVADGASLNVSGTLTNAYNVTKGLGGSLTFSARQYFNTGTNAFTLTGGTTTLAGGDQTLFSGQGVTANTQSFAIGPAATLDLGGTAQLVGYFRSPNGNAYAGSGGVITSATPAVFATRAIGASTENFGGRITGPVTYVQAATANTRNFYADSTYTGATVITGGVLQLIDDARLSGTSAVALNYGSLYLNNRGTLDLADRLPDATPITLRGGRLDLYGRANGISAETVGAVSLAAGFNTINADDGGTGVQSTDLTLSSLARPVGSAGVVRFATVNGQIGSTNRTLIAAAPTLTNSIIGGWAIRDRELAGYVAGLGVGELNAAGFPGYDATTLATGANPTQNVRITASATLTGNTTVNALVTRAGAITIDLGGNTLGLTSGGLLLTSETNTITQTVSNGTLTAGAAGVGGDLYLYWLPYGGTSRVSAVSARVADNAGGPVRLVLSSSDAVATTHKTNLSGANVHTGGTVVNQGQWDLTGAASTVVIPAGGLTLNNAGMTMVTNAGQIASSNVVTLEGSSALTLVGANTLAGVVFDNRGGTGTPTLTTGGTLTLTGGITASSMNVATQATISGTIDFGGAARTLTVNPVAVDGRTIGPWTPSLSLDGLVQNAGTLTVTGGGVLRLGAATSTFTGGYAIDPGTGLIIAASSNPTSGTPTAGPLGTGPLTLGANSRLMSGGTFTVANPVTALGSFMFDGNTSLTVNGAFALPAAGTPAIDIPAPQGSLTIGGVVSGAGTSLTKTGYGLLGLAGANTLDGGVTLSAGTLSLGNAAALGTGPLTLAGGNLDSSVASLALSTNNTQTWSGDFQFLGTQALNLGTGAVSLAGNRTVAVLANTLTVGGGIGDSGGNRSLTKLGNGTLFLGGANTYGGPTTVSAGTLGFGLQSSLSNNVTANWTAANLTVASGATAVFDVGGTGEFTSADIDTIAGLGTATGGFLGGSTIGLDTTNAAAGTFTYATVLADPNAGANSLGLSKRGTGTLVLTAANTFTGPTSLAAGTLNLSSALALQNSTLTPAASTSLVFDQSVAGNAFTLGALSGAVAIPLQNNAGTPAAVALTVGGNNATTTYSGVLSGAGSLTKTGTGTLTLSGTNTYLGTTTVTGGSIVVGSSASLGGTPAAATPANIVLDGGTLMTTAGPTIAANKGVTLGTGGGALIHGGSRFQIDSLIAGSGSLTISGTGAGDVNLTNATSTYSGGLTLLTGGRLPISNSSTPVSGTVTAGPLGTGTLTLAGGQIRAGTGANISLGNLVRITGNSTFYSSAANADRDLIFTAAATLVGGTRTLTVDTSVTAGSTGIFFNNTVSDEGNGYGVTKAGAGTLVFGATNAYSGTTTVSGGALRLATAGALPGGIGTTGGTSGLTLTGGVVDLGFDDFLRPLGTGVSDVQFTGSGGFAASGAARTVNFGGTGASLTWGQPNFVPDGSALILSSGQATNTVTFVHPLALGAATRTVQVNNGTAATDAVLPAVVSGTGGLTKSGNGTLSLAAANTYAGTTTLAGGVASLTSAETAGTSGPLGSGGAITFSGGTLQFTAMNTFDYIPRITGSTGAVQLDTNSQNITFSSPIAASNTGGFTKRGAGTLTLTGTNPYSGTTTVIGGTLSVAGEANIGTGTAISLGGGRLTITGETAFASARNVTLTANSDVEVINTAGASIGTLTGAFTLTKLGTGTLTVNGATNSLTALNLNGGSLELGAASNLTLSNAGGNSLQSTVGGTISGGTLTLGGVGDNWGTANGTTLTISSKLSGIAANTFESYFANNGTGVMVLANPANDFLGNVAINSGTVSVATINNVGVASHLGAGNAAGTISISSSNTSTGRLTYTGTGSTTNRVVNLSGTTSGATLEHAGTGLLDFTAAFTATGAGSKTLTLTGSSTGVGRVSGAIVNNSVSNITTLTKTGTGRWVLSGASTYTGNTNVDFGILQYSAGATTTTPKLFVGYGIGEAAGVVQDSGVSLSIATTTGNADVLSLGGTGGYGYYLNNGGTLAVGQLALVGNSAGVGSTAVFEQNGGSTAVAQSVAAGSLLFGWTGTDTNGVLNIRNGAVYNGSTTNNTTMGFVADANAMGMLNLLGPGAVMDATGGGATPFSGTARGVQLASAAGNFGSWLNLNGGTLTTNFVAAASANTPTFLGFDGGRVRANSASPSFLQNLTSATVYSGGATIDTNGFNITVNQPLLAPTGSGVTSIPVADGGAGYVGAPAVRISGGGGSGASAVAVVDLDPVSPTFGRVTAIQVTSPGSGYTSAPTIALIGGGPATPAAVGTVATGAVASGGLTKAGTGRLTLGATNTYTGPTAITGGSVFFPTRSALGGTISALTASNFSISTGGTAAFRVGGTTGFTAADIATLSGLGTATGGFGNGSTLELDVVAATSLTAPLVNTNGGANVVSLVKTGPAALTLTGANTYSGGTTIVAGSLTVPAGSSFNGTTGTPLAFTGSGRFAATPADGVTQGMGSLSFTAGNGVVESTWAGTGTSTMAFTSLAARGATATGNFVTSGGVNGTENRITLTGQGTGFIDQRLFFGGGAFAWYDAGGFVRGLAYNGTEGTTTAGGTTISGTHVQVTGAVTGQTTGTFSTLAFTGSSAFTLAATQTVTVNGLLKSGGTAGGTISGGSGIQAAAGQALVVRTDAAADTLTIGTPVLANGASSLVKTGAGTLTLAAGAVNTFTGGTFLNEGVLVAAQTSNFGSTAAANPITFNGGTLRASAALSLNANHGLVVNAGGGEINSTSSANTITLASANMLSGTGLLRLTGDSGGTSVLLVSGTNASFAGGIEIASGRLRSDTASATNPLGTGDITVGAGNSSLWINGGTSNFGNRFLIQGNGGESRGVIRLTGAGTTISGPIVLTGDASLINDANVTTAFNGPISGDYGVFFGSQIGGTRNNATTTAIYAVNGNNTQAATRIGAGTLAISSDRALGAAAAPLTLDTGTLRANAAGITLNAARTVTLNAGTTSFIDTNTNALRIDGPIAATSGSLTKVGTGTLTLAGAVGHTGATTVNAGSLVISGTPAAGTALTLGAGTAVVRAEYAGVDATYGSLTVPSNSTSFNELSISSGRTLTINGNVSIGVNADGANTRLRGVGGGSVVVSGSAANFSLGGATGGTNENPVTVDFSALASFTADLGTGTFRMGDLNSSTTGNATLFTLATTNAITAGVVRVGDGSGGSSTHSLTLGSGTNQINAGTINVGSAGSGSRSSGQIVFGASDTTGTIRMRASDGVGRATINLVNTSGSTGADMSGTMDFAGHAADILAGTMTMATRSANTGAAIGTFTFNQGTFDVTSLAMAQRTDTGTGNATATVTLGGGTSTIGSLVMAVNTSADGTSTGTFGISGGSVTIGTGSGTAINMANAAATRTAVSNLNVSGGTVSLLGNLVRTGGAGTETATISLSGGTLDLGGNAIGSGAAAIALNATAGTLRNVLSLNGTGGLTKTGPGLLRLDGTNAWTGGVTLSAGTLESMTATGLGTGNVSVATGSLLRLLDTPGLGAGNAISLPTGAGLVVASGVAAPLTEFSNMAGWSTLPSAGRGTVGDLLFGTVLAGGTTLTSSWSTDAVFDEQYSDVLSLSGTGAGNPFVLSMSYDNATPAGLLANLNIFRRPGTSGPFAPVGTTFTGVGVPWTSAFTTVGQYGVDTASQTVWVVNDTNSQFVVVPEPATLTLAASAAAGIALALRRRLRRAA